MRLLKNIYNEYRIYYDRIQGTELSCNKLLGMIIYKNLFPRDFSELQLGKGQYFYLPDTFDNIGGLCINKLMLLFKHREDKRRKQSKSSYPILMNWMRFSSMTKVLFIK